MTSLSKSAFVAFALEQNVLQFGSFTLKSGRNSPYFFNAGLFYSGKAFNQLGQFYAHTIKSYFPDGSYDVLFGPAYKGITLATATSMAFFNAYGQDLPIAYDRKEAKDHGEGGRLVGAPLKGQRVLLLDDVITAGTTVKGAQQLITSMGGTLVGMVIALDRQETPAHDNRLAIKAVEEDYHIKVASVASVRDIIGYIKQTALDTPLADYIPAIEAHLV